MSVQILKLPDHRFRMNALLGRVGSRFDEYRRTCDRLWTDARQLETNVAYDGADDQPARARAFAAQAGPKRGTFLVDLSVGPEPALAELRFRAQRMTLESAVDSVPGLWGAAAVVGGDPDQLSPRELCRLVWATLDEVVPAGAQLSPWCPAVRLLADRAPDRLRVFKRRFRGLRAHRVLSSAFRAPKPPLSQLVLESALVEWWRGQPRHTDRPCRVAVAGREALTVASRFAHDRRFQLRRATDGTTTYTPARLLGASPDDSELIPTGPWDPGFFSEPVDALVMLGGSPFICPDSAEELAASAVFEVGPGCVLPASDGTLSGRNVDVIPDLVFASAERLAIRLASLADGLTAANLRERVAHDTRRLVGELLRDATARGRTVREHAYLRALANLRR